MTDKKPTLQDRFTLEMSEENKQALQEWAMKTTMAVMGFVMNKPYQAVGILLLMFVWVFLGGVFCGAIPTILTYSGLTFLELVGIIVGLKISFFVIAGISYYYYMMD